MSERTLLQHFVIRPSGLQFVVARHHGLLYPFPVLNGVLLSECYCIRH